MARQAPQSPLLNEIEAAEYLRVSARTLQWWRYRGGGPRYVKLGSRVTYRRNQLDEWIGASTRQSTYWSSPP